VQWELAASPPPPLRTIDAHHGWIRSIAVNADGSRIATGGNDRLVKVWNSQSGELVHALSGHDRHVYSVLFHSDGQSLFSADLRGVIKLWDMASGAEKQSMEVAQLFTPNPGQGAEYGGVRSMAYAPAQNQLICGGLHNGTNPFGAVQDPLVVVVDCNTGQTVRIHTGKDAPKSICWRVIQHPNDFLLGGCGGSSGGFVCFWNSTSEIEFHRFALPNILLDLDLHPDGRQLVTAHHDHHLRLTLLATG
jgi:WD40 repeat protein